MTRVAIIVACLMLILMGAYGYNYYSQRHHRICTDHSVEFMQEYVRSGQFDTHRELVENKQNFENATIPGLPQEDVERVLEKVERMHAGDLLVTRVQKAVYDRCMQEFEAD